MSSSPIIVWFRQDLRLEDNPALREAASSGRPVIPVFIWAPDEEASWAPGGASRWWLHHSLSSLDTQLRSKHSRLILRRGPTESTLERLVVETGAGAVYWNRRYEPAAIQRDQAIKASLSGRSGIEARSFNAALLHEPWTVQNKTGQPYQVFTPFWKACLAMNLDPRPMPRPNDGAPPKTWPDSLPLAVLALEPKLDWASGFMKVWQPGSEGAARQLQRFLEGSIDQYDRARDLPAQLGTSRLSPHLHFGEISPRQIWQAVKRQAENAGTPPIRWRQSRYLTEIGWREFAHHLLYHFPQTPQTPLRPEFAAFPWRSDAGWLKAWQRGETGFPIVDAGMRELWTTGWMHNRVRMITASFLVKDLLLSWQEGARWFWDTLVDADLANNTLGWQWAAGCGADAAPYFRIFNPTLQGQKFDGDGDYVRRWIPEIARLPDRFIHQPWTAPSHVLSEAGVSLDKNYPAPIVQHGVARELALEAYQTLKTNRD